MVEMFRIHYGWRSGAASSANTQHFESRRSLALRLLDLQSEVVAYPASGVWNMTTRIERMFRKRRNESGTPPGFRSASEIYLVQKLVDGEWADITFEFIPAKLILDGEDYSDD